jgi:hypothetical protein
MTPVPVCLHSFLGWVLSISIIAGSVGMHPSEYQPIRTLDLCRFYRAAIKKSESCVPFLPKSVLISYSPVHVNGIFGCSNKNTGREFLLKRNDAKLFNPRWYKGNRALGVKWGRCKRAYRRVAVYINNRRLTNFISGCLTEILDLDLPFRKSGIGKIQQNFRNAYISPQLSYSCVFHLGDNAFRLQPSLNHLNFLIVSDISLPIDGVKLSNQEPYLKAADNNQESTEEPIKTVSPILRYRHGGKFADSYGLFCIIAILLASMSVMALGLILADSGCRRAGICIFVLGLVLDFAACTSGIIGCLPWDWGRCLNDGQEHSENYDFHVVIRSSYTIG